MNEWTELISNEQYMIQNVIFSDSSGGLVQVYYSNKEQFHFGGLNTNVALAAFVTCYARLKLFSELTKIGKNVLYFDTDSIIFVANENDYVPPLGEFLGEFTNEIDPEEGDYIDEFVSAGPKNYAYKLNTGLTHCTV